MSAGVLIDLRRGMPVKALSVLLVAGAIGLCAGMAVLLSVIFQGQDLEFRSRLPFGFLILIVIVAKKLGETAAIISTVVAGLIFAFLLFHPLGSLGVDTKMARSSLAWFLLGGMVCARIVSPLSKRTKRTPELPRRDSD